MKLPTFGAEALRDGRPLRWAVLAPGEIASDFTTTLHANSSHRVVAVGSRSRERGESFATRFGVDNAYASYEAAVSDPAVEAVYVASPNRFHADLALLAISAGKPVLVEKPFAMNADEAERVTEAAARAGVFIMEAMWTSYLPQSRLISTLLNDDAFGDLQLATANVGWRMSGDQATNKIFDPSLGGGVGLDMAVYGIWFAQFALGSPKAVRAFGSHAASGVDDQFVVAMSFDDRKAATVSASMLVTNSGFAAIHGTHGSVQFMDPFVFPARLRITLGGENAEWSDGTGLRGRDGLVWQAVAMARFLDEGRLQSPLHSMNSTIEIARTIDEVERQLIESTNVRR